MQAIFFHDQIVIHRVRTETRPESIDFLRIELVPEVRVEILPSVEEVEDIIEPVVFIDSHAFVIRNFYE